MIGDLAALCDSARRGEIDQVLISGAQFTPKRLEQIVERLSEVPAALRRIVSLTRR